MVVTMDEQRRPYCVQSSNVYYSVFHVHIGKEMVAVQLSVQGWPLECVRKVRAVTMLSSWTKSVANQLFMILNVVSWSFLLYYVLSSVFFHYLFNNSQYKQLLSLLKCLIFLSTFWLCKFNLSSRVYLNVVSQKEAL